MIKTNEVNACVLLDSCPILWSSSNVNIAETFLSCSTWWIIFETGFVFWTFLENAILCFCQERCGLLDYEVFLLANLTCSFLLTKISRNCTNRRLGCLRLWDITNYIISLIWASYIYKIWQKSLIGFSCEMFWHVKLKCSKKYLG